MSSLSVVIVGATGLVGTTLLSLLEEKSFPLKKLYLIASGNSLGKKIAFRNELLPIDDLPTFDFRKSSLAFFCVENDLAAKYIPIATDANNIVIDKSNYFRQHPDVPLIIPEVNLDTLIHHRKMNIIANPNCNTIPICVALKSIYDAVGIKRMNIATYQAISGTGKEAVTEFFEQSKQILANEAIQSKVYPQQIAFNVLPHIGGFQDNGYTMEEIKMVLEIQKIFNDSTIAINPTAVRVPVFCGHSAAVHIETRDKLRAQEAIDLLSKAQGVTLCTGEHPYPTPVLNACGQDNVYIGRIREDISHEKGLNFWIVADNLRKGAALNALQIAEHLVESDVFS